MMKQTVRKLRASALATLAVLGLSYPAMAADKLSIGLSTWVGYGPLYMAQEEGFFKDEGLDVDLVKMEDVKTRMPALAAGRLDAAVTTIDTVLGFSSKDHPLTYLFAIDDSRGGDGIVANDDITSVEGLKGKKVAYTEGSVSQFFLSVLLKNAGMTLKDIDSLNMTAGDAGAAFVSGNVDAAVTWEPWLSRGKAKKGGHVLIDSTKTPGLITDILVTTKDNLDKRKADFEGLYRAWVKAVEFQKSNPEEADKIMAKGVGGWLEDPAVFAETRAGIAFYDGETNKTFMDPANTDGIVKTITNAKSLGEEAGLFKIDTDPASMIATGIVK
ncbi:ABC transporter substrate-binding protein [Rhizobium halophytocola]|uniref:NitT/TauT family transport system substrate-binding protein n=1 Tax=Rhizobium halophytocola TaxID=735519 RepID=A0ABS4E248_9HYPH|nr:ABC transporter substrate-binding protein [Rhizobium halophytocola]MBP1852007.1 NitT/TauT family transport system substrate-binding protein [Rhizobium halophytocola]